MLSLLRIEKQRAQLRQGLLKIERAVGSKLRPLKRHQRRSARLLCLNLWRAFHFQPALSKKAFPRFRCSRLGRASLFKHGAYIVQARKDKQLRYDVGQSASLLVGLWMNDALFVV